MSCTEQNLTEHARLKQSATRTNILQQKFCYHVFKIPVYQHTHFAHLVLSFSSSLCVSTFEHQDHHVLEGDCPSVSCPSHLIIQG